MLGLLKFFIRIVLLSFLVDELLKGKKLPGLVIDRIGQQVLVDLIN